MSSHIDPSRSESPGGSFLQIINIKIIGPYLAGFILPVVFLLAGCNSQKNTDATGFRADKDNAGLILPPGFHAFIVADNLGRIRHIDINKIGDIYMALSSLQTGKA